MSCVIRKTKPNHLKPKLLRYEDLLHLIGDNVYRSYWKS
jgi:hypothetical protein